MHTPSLRARVVITGVAVVALVLIALDVFLYVSLRARLFANLDSVLDTRARIVQVEAGRFQGEALASRLTELGLRATVRTPDGSVHRAEPASPRLEAELPAPERDADRYFAFREVKLPDGSTATVSVRRSGVDRSLGRLLALEVVGTFAAVAVAALLLLRVSISALRPLVHICETAGRTALGRTDERLHPDLPHTELGEMAAAYDRMLDALEGALDHAKASHAHSREMEQRARAIIDTANDAYIASDADGTITDWNPTAERTFGWPRREALGRKVAETIVPPELRQAHLAGIERFRATGEGKVMGRRIELTAQHREGECFPVELSLWATGEANDPIFHAFVHDISLRRAGEEARARLASIVECSDDAIISQDDSGTIVTWNRGAECMYGYTPDEAVGQPLSLIVPPERVWELDHIGESIKRGEPVLRHETVRRTKSGQDVDVVINVSPIRDEGGRVIGASVIGRDVTEQRWLAAALDRTLADLHEAWKQARDAEGVSRQFLADAAHQLRTPMASIRACAETLLRGPSSEERDHLLAHLSRETARAARLVSSLLRIARLDQGEEVSPRRCDLVSMCREEAERACELSPHLQVIVGLGNDLGDQPQLDPSVVQEILANLLDNARRHAARRIDVIVEREGLMVAIRVVDDGPGVPPDLVGRIFDRFVTLDRKGGSGLGLPIARSLARAHGGDLTYEDRSFVIRLPIAVAASEDLATSNTSA